MEDLLKALCKVGKLLVPLHCICKDYITYSLSVFGDEVTHHMNSKWFSWAVLAWRKQL
jgi:hypothetical protein